MSEAVPWKTLHPASVLVNLVPRFWDTFRQLGLLLIFATYQTAFRGAELTEIALAGVFLLIWLTRTLVHALTLRYRVQGGALQIRTGLINVRHRTIDAAKVQNIELVQNVFHRMAGLVEVRIETAVGVEVEALLSALDEDAAQELKSELMSLARHDLEKAPEDEPDWLVTRQPQELLVHGLTSPRIVSAFLVVLSFVPVFGPMLLEQVPVDRIGPNPYVGMTLAGLLAVAIVWITMVIRVIVGQWNLRLGLRNDSLETRFGLLTQRRLELPLDRVQKVSYVEPLARRIMGFGTLGMETAAIRQDERGNTGSQVTVIHTTPDELGTLLQLGLGSMVQGWREGLTRPVHAVLVREMWRAGITTVLALGVTVAFWGVKGLLALLPLGWLAFWRYLNWRRTGWFMTPDVAVVRRGVLGRRTDWVDLHKLQGVVMVQDILMRRYGLAQLQVRVAMAGVTLPPMPEELAEQWLNRLSSERPVALDDRSSAPRGSEE